MRGLQLGACLALALIGANAAMAAERVGWMGKPLRLGAITHAGPAVEKSVRALAGYISEGIHAGVEASFHARYEDLLAELEGGKLDLAILPPVIFLMAREKGTVVPIANPIYQSGETNYRSVLLAPAARKEIAQLSDLKGRRVAFVDRLSASGYIVPRGLLKRAGVTGVQEVFTGNHVKAVQALLAGEVDAAATFDMLLSETPSIGKTLEDFTVLARSDPIPGDVLVGRQGMPGGQALWIRGLLLNFGKRRETDPKLDGCLYQWFFGYDAGRYAPLEGLWKQSK